MRGCSFAYDEYASGCEDEYVLHWTWTREIPETRWQPADGGIEARDAYLNGEPIGLGDVPEQIMDRLVAEAYEQARDAI